MRKHLFLTFAFTVVILYVSCSRDPFLLCEGDCNYSSTMKGFITVESEKGKKIKKIERSSLKTVDIPLSGLVPIAYHSYEDNYLLSTIDENGFKIEIYNDQEKKTLKTWSLPDFITGLSSACFEKEGALWLLSIQEHDDFPRRFVLSRSDSHYKKWVNYLIKDEKDEVWFRSIFSLGSPVERPVEITCGEDEVYIITHQYFQNTMQINVYRFNKEERKLVYLNGYFPVEEKGKVSLHFSIADSTLFIFQNRKMITVKKNLFPDSLIFDEPGEMFFSETDEGVLMLFVPDRRNKEKISGRLLKRTVTETDKEKL